MNGNAARQKADFRSSKPGFRQVLARGGGLVRRASVCARRAPLDRPKGAVEAGERGKAAILRNGDEFIVMVPLLQQTTRLDDSVVIEKGAEMIVTQLLIDQHSDSALRCSHEINKLGEA